MPKKSHKSILFSSKFLCLFFLFGLFSATFLFPTKTLNKNGLVYCPLQKLWVKQYQNLLPIKQNPLEQICMSNDGKQSLFSRILTERAFAIDEQGIFETLQQGIKFLRNYREKPSDFPPQNLVQAHNLAGVLSSKNNLNLTAGLTNENFAIARNPRPPTSLKSNKFDFQISQTLDQISRNINPRSPPIFS